MPKSTSAINQYLGYEFRNGSAPTTSGSFYINLSTTSITESGSGSTIVSGGGYDDVILGKNVNNWAFEYEGGITNAVVISFPSGSGVATSDWGSIMGVTVSDVEGGAPIYFYNLPSSIEVNAGDRVTFPAGSFRFMRKSR